MTSPRRRRFGRLLRFAGWATLSLFLIVVLLYAFRGAIFGESGARALAKLLSRELGTIITIDAVEGNYLTEIELVGVHASPAGSLARFEIARMKVTYPFLAVLRDDPVAAIQSVKVDGLDLEVDAARPGAPRPHRPFSLRMLPARFPELVVSGTVSARSGDDRFIAERVELSGVGNKFALVLDPLRLPDAWKIAPARIDAVLERTGPDAVTWTSPAVIGGVALRSLGLDEKAAGIFELRYDLGVADGGARGAVTNDAIGFSLERVEAAALPGWVRGLVKDPDVLPAAGLVDATGALVAWSTSSRRLSAGVSATAVSWAGIDASSLKMTGSWSGRRFEIETASAAVAGTAISGEAIVLDLDEPRVLVAARRAGAEGPDAAAFAEAIGLVRDAAAPSPNSPRGELGTPWRLPRGWSLAIAASLAEGGTAAAEKVVVESPDLALEASGTVRFGGRWSGWKEFPLAVSWSARSKVAASRPVGEGVVVGAERVVASGEARGTLGHPTGSFTASGARASVSGIPLDRLSASGTVDWPAIVVERLEAASGNDVVKASGKIDAERREVRDGTFELELGSLATVNRVVPGMQPLWGRATVKGTIRRATPDRIELDATLAGRRVRIGKLELGAVDAELSLDGRALGVRRLKVASPYGEVEAQGAVEIADLDAASADLQFTVSVPEIRAWSDFWKPLGRARGAARASGRVVKAAGTPIARSAWNASVRASALEVGEWTVGGASAEVAVRWPLVTVTSLATQGPAGRVTGEAAFDLASGSLATAALDVDVEVQTGSLALGDSAPKLSGTARVAGRIEKVAGPDWRSLRGTVTVTSESLLVEGRELREVLARVASADGTIRVEELSAVHGTADVSARGAVRPVEGGVDVDLDALSLELEDGRSFALKDPVKVRRRAGVLSVGRFEVAGREGRLAGSATIGELIDVALEGRGVDASLFAPDASGRIDLDVTASGKPADLAFSGRVHAPDLRYRGRSVSLEAKFRQENGQLRVEELVIDAGDLLRLEGSGRFPRVTLRDGKLELGPLTDSVFTLKGRTSGAVAWRELGVRAPSRLSDLALEIEAQGPALSLKSSAQLRVRLAREDESPVDVPVELTGRVGPDGALLHVRAGAGEAPLATARVESSRSWDWTQLASALEQGGGFQLGGKLDADVADSAPLAPFFPELRHLGGKLRVHADLAGTIAKPELSGFAELEAFSIRFEADAPGFDDVVARIKLEGRELTIERLEGKTGWSPFSVTGKATLESLRRPVLDVAVKGSNILIQRDEDVRVRADLDTTVKGPLDAMKLSGRARVTDALWGQPMDLGAASGKTGAPPGGGKRAPEQEPVFRFRDPPFSTATLDVEIVSDRSIRVENNLVKARLSARLALVGSGEAPRLEGRISTEHAFVRLPFTRLDVERAEIQFRPQDQYRARLDAVATARLKGYQLTVHVSGILPEVDVKVASLPPLSQRDAYLLLTTGITPSELEREGIAGATLYRAGSVYGTELLSQFSNASDENALERFSLEIGRDQSQDGRPTVDVEAPLSERFFLHGQRDRFDDYNAGIIWRLRFR